MVIDISTRKVVPADSEIARPDEITPDVSLVARIVASYIQRVVSVYGLDRGKLLYRVMELLQ